MKRVVAQYLNDVAEKYKTGTSTEHTYRRELEELLREIFKKIGVKRIENESKTSDSNKPDFVIMKNEIPILYIETKDIGISLDQAEKSEQMTRYFGYANLVLTDYLEFRFYRNGLPYGEPIKLADFNKKERTLAYHEKKFEQLTRRLVDFTKSHKEPIKSGSHLAKIMGGKAQRIRDNIREFLIKDPNKRNETIKVYKTIKNLLVHDLDIDSFSDMYAQTVVYGLFVARFYDKTPDSFSREEARDLIPSSNPFLRHFFDHIIGPDFDKRLEFIVDELCEVFSHGNIEKLMNDFYEKSSKSKTTNDPVIHFYEDFLKEYDPDLRKKMGAYYTPTPVVRFITRSVDHILKKEFKLQKGLADITKLDDKKTHRVQILDPAVGTGTFISGVIREIFKNFKGQEGRWPKYVHNDLLPRIHGFELMMAPYTIAHLKLGMAFKETGFIRFYRRLGIYLTNSLEKSGDQKELFASFGLADSIAQESKEAQKIKSETPIMVVIGNPPYSGESNNAFYTGNDVYKHEPGGGKLQERNSKWINDDYVKFIRLAESMIERTDEGIVSMITAHGYIDNPTFRGMRWHLMETFDSIYVLDLHGNTNKKEISPDGSPDENVFNIKTGVSIIFAIKKKDNKKELADVYQSDLYGKRDKKFSHLEKNTIKSIKWNKVSPSKPNYPWIIRDEKKMDNYLKGFSVEDIFHVSSVGVVTSRDSFVIDTNKKMLANRIQEFLHCQTPQEAKTKFNLKEKTKWKIEKALKHEFNEKNIIPFSYRPFDTRFIYYSDDFIERSRKEVMQHFLNNKNIGLVYRRAVHKDIYGLTFVINKTIRADNYGDFSSLPKMAPLWLYDEQKNKSSNLKQKIVEKIEKSVGKISHENIINYIYAILYSSKYRKKYKEFLKTNFPRIAYPKNKQQFEKLAGFGSQLCHLHLMKSLKLNKFITTFPKMGSDLVEQTPRYKNSNVYINDTQYFGNVPEVAWNFYIGGYQPAQKWLKDRKGRSLTGEEIDHYQRIIVSLIETDKIMEKIDNVIELWKPF